MRVELYDPKIANALQTAEYYGAAVLGSWIEGEDAKDIMSHFLEVHFATRELVTLLRGKVPYVRETAKRNARIYQLLSQGDKAACQKDMVELIAGDIPGFRLEFERRAQHPSIDDELYDATNDLMAQERYSDALRAAFPVFSARLRKYQRGLKERDGRGLVNELFGSSGRMAKKWGSEKCLAVRDLLAGLYGLSRNNHHHNPTNATAIEAHSAILMLHYLLKEVLAKKKPKPKRKPKGPPPSPPAP